LLFVNANKDLRLIPFEPTRHKISYYIGKGQNNWRSGIPTSKAVLYQEVYDHIDLKIYGIEKQVEYDWIVKPGGNVKNIRFRYKEIIDTVVSASGGLEI
jgi:hypothetical protein